MKKLLIGSIVLLFILSGCTSAKFKESMDTGNKALTDKKYSDAVTAFSAAVAEEPKNAEAKQKLDEANKQVEEEKKAKEEAEKKEKEAVSKYIDDIKSLTAEVLKVNTAWEQLRQSSASGAVDNDTFGQLVEEKFLPATTELAGKVKKVATPTEEVRQAHELYIASLEKNQQAFSEIFAAIAADDMSKITHANQLLSDAQKSERDFVAKLKPITEKYNIKMDSK